MPEVSYPNLFAYPGVSYPAFLQRARVRYLELGLGLVLMLGLDVSFGLELRLESRLGPG